jgi:hypothetical protein
MIEASLSEKEAMEISGHKTRAVFGRYHIASDRRMKQNAQKLVGHLKGMGEDAGGRPKVPSTNPLEMMVSRAGLEPATTALKVRCSTN